MIFNRDKFFNRYRNEFGKLTQMQFDGLTRLLDGYETYHGWWDSIPQIANSLAQIKWETAHSFHPVVEGYYLGDPNAPDYLTGNTAYVHRFQTKLRYYPHFGMGHIQLTWEENYREQDGYLRKYFPERVADFERRTRKTFNLIEHPEQVLDFWISFCVMTIGMHKGTFREGQTLDRYINRSGADHYGARNIVNGDARKKVDGVKIGDSITIIARKFEKILQAALIASPVAEDTDAELTADNFDEKFDSLNLNDGIQTDSATGSLPAVSPETPAEILPGIPLESAVQSEPPPTLTGSVTAKQEIKTADGGTTSLEVQTQPGDAPDAAPRNWFNVEDWKPWVFAKLKTTARSFGGFNVTQGTATAFAAFKSGEFWYLPLIVGGLLFVLSLVAAGLVALVLLAIWHFNRKEIVGYKTAELETRHDPSKFNFGLRFEKIGSVESIGKSIFGE